MLPDGKVLIAHQYAIKIVDADKKVLWNRDADPQSEIHTAQMIGSDRVIYIVCGPEPKIVVANWKTDTTEKTLPLPVKNPQKTHGQLRHARLTPTGTYLVAHLDAAKVSEYDDAGKEIWTLPAPGKTCWAADRLANGNTLVTCATIIREVNPAGETVWECSADAMPGYKVGQFQIAQRLANGNTMVTSWVNQWSGPIDFKTAPVQVWEITPDLKIVWALRAWDEPNLGPATTVQLLDEPAAAPAHFGSMK